MVVNCTVRNYNPVCRSYMLSIWEAMLYNLAEGTRPGS